MERCDLRPHAADCGHPSAEYCKILDLNGNVSPTPGTWVDSVMSHYGQLDPVLDFTDGVSAEFAE
jgi:hypothetical protein